MNYQEALACYYKWAKQFSGVPNAPSETLSTEDDSIWHLYNINGPLAVVTAEGEVFSVSNFYVAYERLAEQGKCDSPGGAEYCRVLSEWIKEQPEDMEEFIVWRANAGPEDIIMM